jgi:hypothetical protein
VPNQPIGNRGRFPKMQAMPAEDGGSVAEE